MDTGARRANDGEHPCLCRRPGLPVRDGARFHPMEYRAESEWRKSISPIPMALCGERGLMPLLGDSLDVADRSPAWRSWETRLLAVLGLPDGGSIDAEVLPRPWFIVPDGDELSDQDASGLYAAVRQSVLGDTTATYSRHAVDFLIRLKPERSLPLLYAMRRVARTRGRVRYFWPAFCADVFGDQLDLEVVRGRLAPYFAQVWVRLWRYSRHALYYPQQGLRYIKWPLAHAGLLPEDEAILSGFGMSLQDESEAETRPALLDPAHLDEFQLTLQDWLSEGSQSDSHLALLLSRRDGTAAVVSERAQYWVHDKWADLDRPVADRVVRWRPHVRRWLQFDASRHELELTVRPGSWQGHRELHYEWSGSRSPIRSRYNPATGCTDCLPLRLPLRRRTWNDQLRLTIGGETCTITLPAPPAERSIVFRGNDGRSTNRVDFGESYYVLIPEKNLHQNSIDTLFEEWARLGPPEGEWADYDVLWVRTRDAQEYDASDREPSLLAELEKLEAATDRLGLPSLSHQWKPRIRLFGGDLTVDPAQGLSYTPTSAPGVQVTGAWENELSLVCERWSAEEGSYATCTKTQVPESFGRKDAFLELWSKGEEIEIGPVRLLLDEYQAAEFVITGRDSVRDLSLFALSLGVKGDDNKILTTGLTRRDLDHAQLLARAWPGAHLTLEIECQQWSRTVPIELGDNGEWQYRWRDLGVGGLPDGDLQLTLTWRGILVASLDFADAPYVSEESLSTNWGFLDGHRGLCVSGVLSNRCDTSEVFLLLVGSRPWKRGLWYARAPVEPSGSFSIHVPVSRDKHPAWLLLLARALMDVEKTIALLSVQSLSEEGDGQTSSMSRADFQGTSWTEWESVMDVLRSLSVPPSIQRLIDVSEVGLLLRDLGPTQLIHAEWLNSPRQEDYDRYVRLADIGIEPRLCLMTVVTDQQPTKLLAPFLSVLNSQEMAKVLRCGEGQVRLFCASGDKDCQDPTSTLIVERLEDSYRFTVEAGEWLYGCLKCGLVLPKDLFWDHYSPFTGTKICTGRHPRHTCHRPGSRVTVNAIIDMDSSNVLRCATDLLLAAPYRDETDTPASAVRWIDRVNEAYRRRPDRREPEAWLAGLCKLAHQVRPVVMGEDATMEEFEVIGREVPYYRQALDALFDWYDFIVRE